MALADPRRRPGIAALVYGAGVFAVYAWFLSTLPAYAPLAPPGVETAAALAITLACGVAGGLVARGLAARLVGQAPDQRAGSASPAASLTSPGR
jgi:hypothetical protein